MSYTPEELARRTEKRWSWNLPDKYDKIREHIQNGTELDLHTQRFYDRAVHVFDLLCQGFTEKEVIKLIGDLDWGKAPTARNLIAATKKLFNANPGEAQKNAERRILVEMAKEAYRIALADGNARHMIAAVKELRALLGLDDGDGGLMETYENLRLPDIIYTNDPTALYEAEQPGTFEEVPSGETALPTQERD